MTQTIELQYQILQARLRHIHWSVLARLIKEFHDLNQFLKGKGKAGRPWGKKNGWGIRDTAEALSMSTAAISWYLSAEKLLKDEKNEKLTREEATRKLEEDQSLG